MSLRMISAEIGPPASIRASRRWGMPRSSASIGPPHSPKSCSRTARPSRRGTRVRPTSRAWRPPTEHVPRRIHVPGSQPGPPGRSTIGDPLTAAAAVRDHDPPERFQISPPSSSPSGGAGESARGPRTRIGEDSRDRLQRLGYLDITTNRDGYTMSRRRTEVRRDSPHIKSACLRVMAQVLCGLGWPLPSRPHPRPIARNHGRLATRLSARSTSRSRSSYLDFCPFKEFVMGRGSWRDRTTLIRTWVLTPHVSQSR